jgi:Ni/Co efflux regulator RcnB
MSLFYLKSLALLLNNPVQPNKLKPNNMKKFLSLAVVLMFTASAFANTNTGKKNNDKNKTHAAPQDKAQDKDKRAKADVKGKGSSNTKGDTKPKADPKAAEAKPKK